MMKSALKRTRDPGADAETNTDGFPQRAAAPSPAPKRLAWCVFASIAHQLPPARQT